MRKTLTLLLSLLFFVSFISIVKAPQDIDITDFPEAVGESFGVPSQDRSFVGGIVLSMVIVSAVTMPFLLMRNKAPALFICLLALCFCLAVTWLPVGVMLLIVAIVASMFAGRMKRLFT